MEANQPIVELVKQIAQRKGATPGQIALAWLLAKSSTIVPIPGSRKIARVTENIQAADVTLTADEVAEIDHRSAHLTVTGAGAAATSSTADSRRNRGDPAETADDQGPGRDVHR